MIKFLKRTLPFAIIVLCWIAVIFHDYNNQAFDLYIKGDLPYGVTESTLRSYLDSTLGVESSFERALGISFEQTSHFQHIEIKRILPSVVQVNLERKPALATWNKSSLMLEDGSLVDVYGSVYCSYHVDFNTINKEYIKQIFNLLLLLKEKHIQSGKLEVSASQVIKVTWDNVTVLLPAPKATQRLRELFSYYKTEWPQGILVNACYEQGFVFKKKQSARI